MNVSLTAELEHLVNEKVAARATSRVSTSQGRWQVRYLLQAADDPSLIVPAAQVWKAVGRQAALLKRGAFRPRE